MDLPVAGFEDLVARRELHAVELPVGIEVHAERFGEFIRAGDGEDFDRSQREGCEAEQGGERGAKGHGPT